MGDQKIIISNNYGSDFNGKGNDQGEARDRLIKEVKGENFEGFSNNYEMRRDEDLIAKIEEDSKYENGLDDISFDLPRDSDYHKFYDLSVVTVSDKFDLNVRDYDGLERIELKIKPEIVKEYIEKGDDEGMVKYIEAANRNDTSFEVEKKDEKTEFKHERGEEKLEEEEDIDVQDKYENDEDYDDYDDYDDYEEYEEYEEYEDNF